jgi:hypothetical protein
MIQKHDLEQLKEKNISVESFESQIERFKHGFPALKIERPATLTDGIIPLSESLINASKKKYHEEISSGLHPLKFVPASGAASRMFKALYQYLENPVDFDDLSKDVPVYQFIENLPKFAFFSQLEAPLDLNSKENRIKSAREIIAKVLNDNGLNYGFLPKGLILFHNYHNAPRTSMIEHLVEGSEYAKDNNEQAKIHFTVSPEHLSFFKDELNQKKTSIENQTQTSFDVSFSFQKPHTDTIAVFPNNEPFRDEAGILLFRPGGHGSLIENLNDCEADIIFVKNIDNVVPENKLPEISEYKQVLGGLALKIRNQIFAYIEQLDNHITPSLIEQIRVFLKETLHTDIPGHLADASFTEQGAYLLKYFDRPIRVCGMVKNEGEPGGGPFWVKNKDGQDTLQIVESSQIDMDKPEQRKLFEASTHFNPVDLVCITKNHKKKKFDLLQFIDQETGFITDKSVNGKTIKALERPGLWNGAMAHWLTIFAEVPVKTFNPVKTINDLLRPAHQVR